MVDKLWAQASQKNGLRGEGSHGQGVCDRLQSSLVRTLEQGPNGYIITFFFFLFVLSEF